MVEMPSRVAGATPSEEMNAPASEPTEAVAMEISVQKDAKAKGSGDTFADALKHDANNDNHLQEEEYALWQQATGRKEDLETLIQEFRDLDVGSRYGADEFDHPGGDTALPDADTAFSKEYDLDGNEHLDYEEFSAMIQAQTGITDPEVIQGLFTSNDGNDSGRIGTEEYGVSGYNASDVATDSNFIAGVIKPLTRAEDYDGVVKHGKENGFIHNGGFDKDAFLAAYPDAPDEAVDGVASIYMTAIDKVNAGDGAVAIVRRESSDTDSNFIAGVIEPLTRAEDYDGVFQHGVENGFIHNGVFDEVAFLAAYPDAPDKAVDGVASIYMTAIDKVKGGDGGDKIPGSPHEINL